MPSSTDRQPMRTCIGCRRIRPSVEMTRVTLVPNQGRGAWVCDLACFDAAAQSRSFNRAFRQKVPDEVIAALRVRIAAE